MSTIFIPNSVQSTAIHVVQSASEPNFIFYPYIPDGSIGFVDMTFPEPLNNCSSPQYLLFVEFFSDDLQIHWTSIRLFGIENIPIPLVEAVSRDIRLRWQHIHLSPHSIHWERQSRVVQQIPNLSIANPTEFPMRHSRMRQGRTQQNIDSPTRRRSHRVPFVQIFLLHCSFPLVQLPILINRYSLAAVNQPFNMRNKRLHPDEYPHPHRPCRRYP
jgi:hypothetical protein